MGGCRSKSTARNTFTDTSLKAVRRGPEERGRGGGGGGEGGRGRVVNRWCAGGRAGQQVCEVGTCLTTVKTTRDNTRLAGPPPRHFSSPVNLQKFVKCYVVV